MLIFVSMQPTLHKHTNSLINESSPYLQQHAHNPVNWYPWGNEALQKAKAENKLILVSIGYAACHWCHVMERESFENEVVAAKMNRNFVNIKIDREERPDLDHIYMDAVQAMTGSGGWPLNVFLTPDAVPFYGGTYFPPVRAYNRSSWTEVIEAIAAAWKDRPGEISSQAANLLEHLEQQGNIGQLAASDPDTNQPFSKQQCSIITTNILKQADTVWGGFGKAPKFPQTFTIQYLLQYHHFTKDEAALQQALLSLNKMIDGGIYDHAGGGFARYSTDTEWLAPHFEKMLYDNALLLNVLSDAYQVTGLKKYDKTIRHTIAFLQREMMHPQGGFYAALDADSEGEEGKFYVWKKAEVDAVLGEDAALFCAFYDVTENGNWEEKNILRILKDAEVFASENNLDTAVLERKMDIALTQLLHTRKSRVRPGTDDKILLGWNSLLITALCKAGAALGDDSYIALAVNNFDFVFEKMAVAGVFYHTYKNGEAKYPAFLDDYAFLIQACIHLQEVTSNTQYLEKAAGITQHVIDNFFDPETGSFMFTHKDQQDVIMRKKEVYDGATPSGNSIMAENLFYLAVIFDRNEWKEMARKMLVSLNGVVERYPTSFGVWASIFLKQAFGMHELVVTGPEFLTLRRELLKQYIPSKVLQCGETGDERYPLLRGKTSDMGNNIYWCREYECLPPFHAVEDLVKELEKWNYSTSRSQ